MVGSTSKYLKTSSYSQNRIGKIKTIQSLATYVAGGVDPGVVDGAHLLSCSFIELFEKGNFLLKAFFLVVNRLDSGQ